VPGQETLVAALQLEISQFTSQLQAATQQFSTFAQGLNSSIQQASQSFTNLSNASKTANQELNTETRRARNEQVQIERDAQRSINQAYRQERQQVLESERDIQRALTQAFRAEQQARSQAERTAQQALNAAYRQERQQVVQIERDIQREVTQVARAEQQQQAQVQRTAQQAITQAFRAEQQERLQAERTSQHAINQAARAEQQVRLQQERDIQRSINQAFKAEAAERASIERETQRSVNAAHRAGLEERRAREESINYQITQLQRNAAAQQRSLNVKREFAFEQRAGTAGNVPTVSPGIQQAISALQGYEKALNDTLIERQGRFNTALTQMGSILGAAGIAVSIAAIVSSLKDFATEAVKNAVTMQSLEASFKGITGSSAAAKRELDFLRATSQRVGVDFLETAGAFKGLEAAAKGTKLEGEETRKIFVAMVEASRTLGLRSDQTRLALLAFEQMISKGKVSSEELRRQLGEHLPGAMQLAAKAMGVSTAELDKMLRAGEVLTEDFLPKFRREIQKAFGSGLEDATKTGAASFARFANNMRDISIDVGNSILRILKPILDAINVAAEKSRQLKAERVGELTERVRERIAGTSVSLDDLTPDEIRQVGRLLGGAGEATNLSELFGGRGAADRIIQEAGKRKQQRVLQSRREQEDETPFGVPSLAGARPFAAQSKEVAEINKQLKEDLAAINNFYRTQPSLIGKAAEELKATEKAQRAISELQAKSPGLQKELIPDIQKVTDEVTQQAKVFREKDEAEKAAAKADRDASRDKARELREATQEAERLAEKRKELVNSLVQGQQFSLRSTDIKDITADITHFENQLKTATGPQLEAIGALLANLYDAKQKAFGAAPDTFAQDNAKVIDGLERIKKELEEVDPSVEKVSKALAELAKGEGVDAYTEKLNKIKVKFDEIDRVLRENLQNSDDALARSATQRAREIGQAFEEETKKSQQELAKQQAEYNKFAKGIQDTLSRAFEGVLNGSRSIFDSIKQLFIKLLADLAAAALTHAVIIPVITQFFGSGGSAGGTASIGGGSTGAILSVIGVAGGAASDGGTGGGGGGGTLESVLGLAQQGSNLYSSASGGSSLLSGGGGNTSLLSIIGKNPAIQNILNTSLVGGATFGGIGAGAAGLTGAPAGFLGGSGAVLGSGSGIVAGAGTGGAGLAGAPAGLLGGSGAAPGATAAGAGLTVGSAVAGAAAGIAVGFTLSEINDLLGLKDLLGSRGSSALAGAGGGAVGGALVGSVIAPGIGTAIGAIIGTIVGALGGYLFGGSSTPKPKLDIQDVTRPTVSFDEEFGLQTQGKFQVLQAPFRDIGKFNYGEFLGRIDNSINDLFGQILSGLSSLSPKVQEALVAPLNNIAEQIELNIESTKFEGKDALEKLRDYFGTKLPEFVTQLLRPLQDGLQKIDPVAKAFEEVIDKANEILVQLAQQEAGILLSIQEQIHGIQEGFFTPAQTFLRRQDELEQVQAFIAQASPEEKLAAIPTVQRLVDELFQLGRSPDVLGDNAALIRNTQEQIAELERRVPTTKAEDLPALIAQLDPLRQQLDTLRQSDNAAVRDLQAMAIRILEDLQGTTDQAFGTLGDGVQQQVNLAEQQIDILIASLGNLGGIDAVIAASLPVLQDIRSALAPFENQDMLSTQIQTALTAASVQSLQNIDTTAQAQLTELQSINANLGGIPASPNVGNGSDGADGGGNALGLGFVPRNAFYFLHQGEAVIPAHLNNTGSNGGNVVVHINGATGDPDAIATAVIAQIERRGGRLASSRIMVSKR
jgi:tape measure domain-containing protein